MTKKEQDEQLSQLFHIIEVFPCEVKEYNMIKIIQANFKFHYRIDIINTFLYIFQIRRSSWYNIIKMMDQNLKKKIVIVKGLIQKKEYKQALQQLEVLMYKYQKAYQVHLMSGLCYEKLNKQLQAEKCYKEVIDLKEDQGNAIKALCQIYTKRNDIKNATLYLEKNVELLKKLDDKKYRQALVKLVQIYRKDENLQKIYNIFIQYTENQQKITDDFVQIADAYYRVSINCKSFNLQKFQLMGMKADQPRPLQMSARQRLNILLIDIVQYLKAVSKQYNLTQKDIANSLYEMKCYFPYAPCLLMLMLLDEYCVGQVGFSVIILPEIYKLLSAFYNKEDNSYLNLEFTQPEIFTVSMILSYEYLAFFKQFFTLDLSFNQFFDSLALKQEDLLKVYKVREDYLKKINNFILKKCRFLNKISQSKNVQNQIQDMKKRIQLLDGSFLQEVIAKIGMNCFVNYQKLDDMKNMLKIRIKNLQEGDMVPHLYKYYVDYLIKIAKIYKILDEEINIYEAVDYINKYDPNDAKYLIEGYWLKFSRSMLFQTQQEKVQIAQQSIKKISEVLDQTTAELRAESLRKIVVLKIFTGDFQVQQYIKEALLIDRSFPNLQTMGFFCFYMKKYEQALNYLKEAFILNQSHYHTNRLIFILLFKLGFQSEAIDFIQRIKEGFRSVFWVNYVLALKNINQRKYQEAEGYLNSAIESFSAGIQKKYKFSYEKIVSHKQFAFLYMIQQNQFTILYDEIILPQQILYSQLKMVSSLYFELQTKRTQIKLFSQMGEVLKILGRTKSALNYLGQAFNISEKLDKDEKNQQNQNFQICILYKQYATLLFYMNMFRQCQIVICSAYNLCKFEIEKVDNLQKRRVLEKIESQIDSLSFEVAVERLSIMERFQSYETVEEYLNQFKIQQPKNPSTNFLKGKYQFYILQYLHRRHHTLNIESSVQNFLRSFNLNLENGMTSQFQNRYFELDFDKKTMVREALEDYFVVKYISAPQKLNEKEIMPFIQIFPRSTVFYIIFGMSTLDLKLKTAAFLKCIQLDKQSPISIDLLASLYLKQKNYLAAAKLFLKSLEMNILNSKCYLGLSICLFCIVGKNLSSKEEDVIQTIHKALIRINSYMEYLRTVDPSQNYHLLKFLKLLVNDEHVSNFQIKTVLQASKKNSKYKYKDTLVYTLLEQATMEWKQHNIWKHQGQITIIQGFVSKFHKKHVKLVGQNCLEISKEVLQNSLVELTHINEQKNQKYEFIVKQIHKILNQVCIATNLSLKGTFNQKFLQQVINLLSDIEKRFYRQVKYSQQNLTLIKKLKSYLFEYCLLNSEFQKNKENIENIFKSIPSYDYLTRYPHLISKFQKELFRQILINPSNDQLKKILSNHMIVNAAKKINKSKSDYKVELINITHDNLNIKKETFKKLCLLYRDPQSYLGYITMCWQDPKNRTKHKIEKYLSLINKLQSSTSKLIQPNTSLHESPYNLFSTQNKQKINALKMQMLSFYILQFGQTAEIKKINLILSQDEKIQIKESELLTKFYQYPGTQSLKGIKNLLTENRQKSQFVLLKLLSYVTRRYQYNQKLQFLLIELIDLSHSSPYKSHLLLLRYLYVLHRTIKTEEDLVDQIISLEKIINACEQAGVSQNTVSILKCSKCLFSADYQNLSIELTNAAKKKVVTYSDQVLINFFQIMRLYKQIQNNPNKEGVIEQFAIYIEQMILLVKDPFYQGFFFSLKAMVNAIIVPDESFIHDRNLRFALILSPYAGQVFVKNSAT